MTGESRGQRRRRRRLGRRLRRLLLWAVAGLALLVASLSLLLDTETVRRRGGRWLEARLAERLERPVQLGSIDFDLVPLALEVRDLRIAAAPDGSPDEDPLLVVPRVLVEADLLGLVRPLLVLRRIAVEAPRLAIEVAEDGSTNLPPIRAPDPGGRIELEIRGIDITGGSIEINERRLPLELVARGVQAALVGAGGVGVLGDLRAERIELETPGASYPLSLAGRVSWDRDRVEVLEATARGTGLEARAVGFWRFGGGRAAELELEARLDAELLHRFGHRLGWQPAASDRLGGEVVLNGALAWSPEGWGVRGELEAPSLAVAGQHLSQLRATLSGEKEGGRVDLIGGQYQGGELTGSLTLPRSGHAGLGLRLEGARIETLLAELGPGVPRLAGRLHGGLDYRFDIEEPLGGSGWIDLEILPPEDPAADGLPLSGALPLTVQGGVLSSDAVVLELPGQLALIEARYEVAQRRGSLSLAVDTDDASILAGLLRLGPGQGPPAPWRVAGGHGAILGEVGLAPGGQGWPRTAVRFELAEVRAPGLRAEHARGSLIVTDAGVENLVVELAAEDGALHLSGDLPRARAPTSAPLRPALVPDLRAEAAFWPMAELVSWLGRESGRGGAGIAKELGGAYSGSVEITSRTTGRARGRVDPVRYRGEELGRLALTVAWSDAGLRFERLRLAADAGELALEGRVGWPRAPGSPGGRRPGGHADHATERADAGEAGILELELRTAGLDLRASPLRELNPTRLAGELAGTLRLFGDLGNPLARGDLVLRELELGGRPLGGGGNSRVELEWERGRLQARGELPELLSFAGGGELRPPDADLVFAVSSDQLGNVVRLVRAERDVAAAALEELEGGLEGELLVRTVAGSGSPRVELVLARIEARWRERSLANLDPLRLRWEGGPVEIVSLYLGEAESSSELFVAGTVDPASGALDLRLESSLAAGWLDLLDALDLPVVLDPELELDGRFELLATVVGTGSRPRLNGQGRLTSGRLIFPALPHAVDELEALLLFYPDRVILDRVAGTCAGGEVRAQGDVRLPPAGEALEYRLQAQLRGLDLHYPEDWNLRGDADLTLAGTSVAAPLLAGRVVLERAAYLGEVEVGVGQLLRGLFARDRLEVERGGGPLEGMELRLQVSGPGALRVRNRVADVRGDVDLLVRGTQGRPVLFGEVALESEGRLRYGGDDFLIARGLLTFSNPYRIDPLIDLVATTRRRDYEITLNLAGTRDRLEATLQSDPPLPELDVLGLLAGGDVATAAATPLGGGGAATGEASVGALELLYGQATSLVEERVSTLFGLDRFRLAPLTKGEDAVSSTRVTVGKQLSKDLLVTYSVDPASSEEYVVEVEWQVSNRVTVILTQNADGSYSADARLERSF